MSKKTFACISLFLLINFSRSQEVKYKILDSLYIDALNNRFDLLLSSGYKYIEPNKETKKIKNNFKESIYKFPSRKEIFDIAYKAKKGLAMYRLTHKVISKDTIDINFEKVYITVQKGIFFHNGLHFKKLNSYIYCDGIESSSPDFRYVFSSIDHKWININENAN